MKYIKLNKNWNAEPNAPDPIVSKTDEGIALTFLLNSIDFQHIDDKDKGSLEFSEVYAYRLNAINDESYFHGQFRFTNNQLPWGEFYELIDSKWKNNFPKDKVILNDAIDKSKVRHFIFFLKNEIFECLALDYKFTFMNTVSDQLEEKYPKGYLNHYLAMFNAQFNKPTLENFTMYTDLYIQMEGKREFIDLKTEIKTIKSNNDLNSYLKFANYFEMENFGIKQLNEMIKVIEAYKIDRN